MMHFIREKSQGWFAWTIIGAICLVFALWGVRSYLYSAQESDTIVTVNGTEVTQQQFSMIYNQMKRQQQVTLGANYSPTTASSDALKQIALQSIISNIVLSDGALSAGFQVAPELVDATLAQMPIFQVNGAFSEARFQQVLNAMLYSPDDFFNEVSHNILTNQVQFGIIGSSFALPTDVTQAIQLINQKRTFSYAILPASRFLGKVTLSSNAISDYYTQHAQEFQLPAKVSIEYLRLSVADLMKKINPTSQQIQDFYNNNITSYAIPKEWKVARILVSVPMRASASQKADAQKKMDLVVQQIKNGVSFDSLAKKYSDDQITADNGGILPWQNSAQFAAELQPTLRDLKNAGDISTPVYIDGQGYEILKLIAVKPEKIMPFASVKNNVLNAYKQQQAEQKFSDLSDQLSNMTYESPNSLQPAATKLGLQIQSTPLFTQSGGNEKILQNSQVLQMAFSDEVVNQHDNSDPININDNDIIILRAKQYIPAQVKPLSEVKNSIETILRSQAASTQAQQVGKQILAALNQGMSLSQASKKFDVIWKQANQVGRHEKSFNMGILMLAFKSPVPSKALSQVNTGDSLGNGDFAIISLTKVIAGESDLPGFQKAIFRKGTENTYAQLEYASYVDGLMKKANIKKLKDLNSE